VPTPSRSARARRLAALETGAAERDENSAAERLRAALAALSQDELHDLAAEALVAHGVDRAIAREVWENYSLLHCRHPKGGVDRRGGWAELAARADDVMEVYVADLKNTAALGGAPPELAERLDDLDFRRLVFERARAVFGRDPHHFCQGFAWVLAKVAAGAPAGEITRLAYYGAERVAEQEAWKAECTRRRAERG
jgi:hypothetical protein